MGADLITYLVVGPDTITLSDYQRTKVIKQLRTNAEGLRQECLKELDQSNEAEPTVEDFGDALSNLGTNERVAPCLVDSELAETVLDDFLSVWHDLRRDANKRLMPGDKERCIFVAGEMSWGDAPPGEAYRTMDFAACLGLLPLLGIE